MEAEKKLGRPKKKAGPIYPAYVLVKDGKRYSFRVLRIQDDKVLDYTESNRNLLSTVKGQLYRVIDQRIKVLRKTNVEDV